MSVKEQLVQQRQQLDQLIQPLQQSLQQPLQKPELVKDFYRIHPTITYNTYQRNITNARTAFLDLIAPNGDITQGIYSEAYKNPEKKIDIENFVQNLMRDDYNVYDWKIIKKDLWDKKNR